MEYKRAGYELQKSIRAAKRAHSQKPEGYYVNHNTHSMWQVIKSTQSTTREPQLPQTTEMPPSQTALTPSKARRDHTDTAFQVTLTQVPKALNKVNHHRVLPEF